MTEPRFKPSSLSPQIPFMLFPECLLPPQTSLCDPSPPPKMPPVAFQASRNPWEFFALVTLVGSEKRKSGIAVYSC